MFIIKEDQNCIIATHNGYRKLRTTHQRQWNFNDHQIQITDTLIGKIKSGIAHFWFEPNIQPEIRGAEVYLLDGKLSFENAEKVEIIKTKISVGYNKFKDSYKVEINFNKQLKTIIKTK